MIRSFRDFCSQSYSKEEGMRRFAGAAMALVLIVGLTGCSGKHTLFGQQEETVKSLKIGVSVYDQYDTFISSMLEYMNVYVKEKEKQENIKITMEVVNAGHSQLTQNDQVEEFLNDGYDVVCVNLVDRTDASTIIEKAKNTDTPVIFFNRELVEEDLERWDKLYYVGAEAFESGIMQGNLVVECCRERMDEIDKNGDGRLQYVILEGEAGHQDSLVRTEYAIKTVTDSKIQVERLADEIANWNRAQAMTKTAQWLNSFGEEIEVIFANNDDMALGAIDALKEDGPQQWPVVVGIDGTDVALEAVRKQELYGTVLNDARGQSEGIIELAWSLCTNHPLSEKFALQDGKYIRLPYEPVTYQNLEEIEMKKQIYCRMKKAVSFLRKMSYNYVSNKQYYD